MKRRGNDVKTGTAAIKHVKIFRAVTGLLLICILLAGLFYGSNTVIITAETDFEKKLSEAEKKKKELEKRKKETQQLLSEFKQEKANIEAYIQELDLQMNDISLRLFELQENIAATETELEITGRELEKAKENEENQYEIMKRRIQYMYENGETTYADVLLASDSIEDMLNQSEYMSGITEYDDRLLDRYKLAKQEVSDKEAYLEASLDEFEALEESALLEQETVNGLMELKAAEIERFTEQIGITDELLFNYIDEISSAEKEIDKIIEDEEKRKAEEERRRQEELERIRREEEERRRQEELERKRREGAESGGTPQSTQGYDASAINNVVLSDETDIYKMIWPLPGDHRTYSKFGPRKAPTKGASTFHKGWDIGGEFGAPIVSVLAGTVVVASYNSSGGNYVRIDHGNGVMSVYCHCSKFLISQGDYVQQGQKIALVGSTGVSTAPHLHFAITLTGEQNSNVYVDPSLYIGHLE